MHRYFIGISVSELQQWLADDVLPVLIGRIAYSKMYAGAASSAFAPESLFRTLPAFAPDDPAGVLVAEVSSPGTWGEDDDPSIRCLPLSGVKRFIPLTEDAGTALTLHLAGMIALSPAIFEHEFTHFRISRKTIASNRAGNLFANLLINHGPGRFAADSHFADSLPRALTAAEHRKPDEIAELFGQQAGEFPETWVERAFGDTRPARNNRPVNLKNMPVSLRGIYMLGVLMAGAETVEEQTGKVRTVWKSLEEKTNGTDPSLAMVYGDPTLSGLEIRLDVAQEGSARVSLVTLALFLHWKLAFHDQRSTVDVPSILNDVKSLAGLVKLEQIANALWMLGAYLGMEHVAPTYRYLHREKYPALQFAGQEERLEVVRAWQLHETACPPEHELAASVRTAVAAGTPPPGSTPADNTGDREAPKPGQQGKKDVPGSMQTEDTQEDVPDGAGPSAGQSLPGEHSPANDTVALLEEPQTLDAGQGLRTDDAAGETPEQTHQTAPPLPAAEAPVTTGAGTPATTLPGARDEEPVLLSASQVAEGQTGAGSVESPQESSKAARTTGNTSKTTTPGRNRGKNGKGNASPEAPATPATVKKIRPADATKPEVSLGEKGQCVPEDVLQDDLFRTGSGADNTSLTK